MNDTPFPTGDALDNSSGSTEWLDADRLSQDASCMSCRSFRQPVRICNPQGLHMRPAAAFATLARSFTATVTVWSHEQSVNGKSFIDLIMLAAECGTELVLEVSGDDAESALAALADLLAAENLDDAT